MPYLPDPWQLVVLAYVDGARRGRLFEVKRDGMPTDCTLFLQLEPRRIWMLTARGFELDTTTKPPQGEILQWLERNVEVLP